MSDRVTGKVAFVTGAARGQGRSHALRLAEEGADIIALDLCDTIDTVGYPLSTKEDMQETIRLVEDFDRRIFFEQADVRDLAQVQSVAANGLAEFGHIDIVCANAGIATAASLLDMTEDLWQTMIDINLTGVWKTLQAVVPGMVEADRGGSIILTSSIAGLVGYANMSHYTAAKHGVTGLMRGLAIELAPHNIRVNTVHPSNVDSDMIQNPYMRKIMVGDENATREEVIPALKGMHALPIPWVDTRDISNAVLWLASDEARYVTGTTQVIDAGGTAPFKLPH